MLFFGFPRVFVIVGFFEAWFGVCLCFLGFIEVVLVFWVYDGSASVPGLFFLNCFGGKLQDITSLLVFPC